MALRREANAAGDELQASLCNSAIRGNADHRYACAVVMADAEYAAGHEWHAEV